jgi:hypothetical protein
MEQILHTFNVAGISVGVVGGTGGLTSLYHASGNKRKRDIENMQKLLDGATKQAEIYRKELSDYKAETTKYIEDFKVRFDKIERRADWFERLVLLAYRCKYAAECLLLKEYEKKENTKADALVGNNKK